MLIGQHAAKVGEKGRIAFPKRFRELMGDKLIITYGFESSLVVVSESNWKSLLEGTEDKPFLLSGARDTQRFLLGGAVFVDLDAQGRFILPDYLREFASVGDEVVIVGLNKHVEIWDRNKWEKYTESIKSNISQIAGNLIEKINEK
jgi:MraZ protein